MPNTLTINDFSVKPADYYLQTRPEMLEFIPKTAKRILDVGCGAGGFGAQLKHLLTAEVWGVEFDHDMAALAKEKLDNVFVGDAFQLVDDLPGKYFDCIVFNDVLEHLVDPFTLLLKAKDKLTINGIIVCSIPNVRFFYNLRDLLVKKQWKYEDSGILDRTHLRFFTKKSIIDMFDALGYKILKLEGINPIPYSWKFHLLNFLFLGYFSDTKYLQYACVVVSKNMEESSDK